MYITSLRKLNLVLVFLFSVNFLFAQKEYSRENFPSKNDVFTKVKGNNEKETLLKQAGVFLFLRNNGSFSSNKSKKEIELWKGYDEGLKEVRNKYDKTIASLDNETNQREYFVKTQTIDNELKKFVINNLFDEKTRKDYLEDEKNLKEYQTLENQKMKESNEAFDENAILYKEMNQKRLREKIFFTCMFILGFIFLINPLLITYFIGKRNFYRKKQAGNDSYNMIWGKAISKVASFYISVAIMLLGALLMAGSFDHVFSFE